MTTANATSTASPVPTSATPAELLFGDLATELATTRRVLERVPDGRVDWHPHEKSMSLGRLATHLAELPRFTRMLLETEELDWATSDYTPRTLETTAERLALFDVESAAMRAAVEAMTWEAVGSRWMMRAGDHVILAGPRGQLLRTIGMSHMVHHRAQLGVYLRLLGVPVPGVYGPSADER
jgi:uncharacterized damage-inducible protein DinB